MDSLKQREVKQNEANQEVVYEGILHPLMSINRAYINELKEFIMEVSTILSKQGFEATINMDIPNVVITGHNKLSELVQRFKKANILFFAKAHEGVEYVDENYTGSALLADILDRVYSSIAELNQFEDIVSYIMKKDTEADLEIANKNKIKKIILGIKNKIVKTLSKASRLRLYEKYFEFANLHINNYCMLDALLDEYTIEDNVVEALVKKIMKDELDPELLKPLINEEIKPDFEKLGILDLIPELQARLIEEYKKMVQNPEQITEKNQDLFIPRFDDSRHTRFTEQYAQDLSDDGERYLEQVTIKKEQNSNESNIGEKDD